MDGILRGCNCLGVWWMVDRCYYKEDLSMHYTESELIFNISNIHVSATLILIGYDKQV